jgi:hypothetical protein
LATSADMRHRSPIPATATATALEPSGEVSGSLNLPSLRCLHLDSCRLLDDQFRVLSSALGSTLVTLELRHMRGLGNFGLAQGLSQLTVLSSLEVVSGGWKQKYPMLRFLL